MPTSIGDPDPERALPPAVPVGRDSTAGVAVMAHLRRQTAALLEASSGVGDDDGGGSVHATRVATRRLRAGLRLYGDLLEGDVATRLRSELSWYAGALSPLRDVDVFLQRVAGDDEGVAAALVPWLRRRREELTAQAVEALGSGRGAKLRVDLVTLARAPRFAPTAGKRASKVLTPRVLREDRRAADAIDELDDSSPAAAWHAARIGAKRARYAAEVGAPAVGRPAADLAELWSTMTDPLGEAQDAVIQRGLVLERVDDPAMPLTAAEAFACGTYVATTRAAETSAHLAASARWRETRDEHRRLRRAVERAR